MNTEEKARRYDEALKRAKTAIDLAADKDLVEGVVRTILPELKENENERTRKEIIHYLSYTAGGLSTEEQNRWIAYLEKQKESLPIPDKFSGLKSLMLQYLQSAANRKDDTEIERDTDLWGRKILDYVWKYSDEQKEQKPLTTEETELNSIAFLEQMGYTCIPPRKEQKPAEWSEFDESCKQTILCAVQGKFVTDAALRQAILWLKSLSSCPKSSDNWKPTEEQMKALERTTRLANFGLEEDRRKALISLYEQLKNWE